MTVDKKDTYDWRQDAKRFLRMLIHFDPMWLFALVGVTVWVGINAVSCRAKPSSEVVIYAASLRVRSSSFPQYTSHCGWLRSASNRFAMATVFVASLS